MGLVERRFCDLCQSEDKVEAMTVVRSYGKRAPWEVDICQSCFDQRFADLRAKSRRPDINNVRPQHRLVKTEISEENL